MPAETTTKQPVAVIDIGTSGIRMAVAEVGAKSEIHYLENLQKPVPFGKDVFTSGRISNSVMRDGIEILKNFKTVIDGYNIKNIHAIATSAVREASNRDNFVDRVFVQTGIDVEVVEGAEENRLVLIAIERVFQDKFDFDKKNCLVIEVGSGSTEMIILNKGVVELTRMLSIGSVRLPEQAIAGKTEPEVMQRVLKRSIHGIAVYAGREYNLGEIDTFIALGGDMRFAAKQLIEKPTEDFSVIENKEFQKFVTGISKLTAEEIVDKYGIPYAEAETLYPSLLIYANFANETKSEKIVVPAVSIRDGLLIELSQLLSGYKRTDLSKQVISSAKHLAKKYQYDESHSLHVASLSVKLFDLLKPEHGLGTRERLLLEVSAILHDIGMFIAATSHHKHSSYLIDAAEIFGLRKSDKDLVSNVVRYHRRASPQPDHVAYMSLTKQDRATVSKLAAILRVADSLDRSHQQKIRAFELETKKDSFVLWVPEEIGDVTLERDGLSKKGSMFSDIFGRPVLLKQGSAPKT